MGYGGSFVLAHGYLGVFALLMLGIVGIPVPDEWLLIFTGYLVFKGDFRIVPALSIAAAGSMCGISVTYLLGRTLGSRFVRKYGHWLRLTGERMDRVNAWFNRTGRWSFLVGFFIPGIRHLAGFAAGASRVGYRGFAPFAYAGAIAWSATFVAVGYFFGEEWAVTDRSIHRKIISGAILAAAALLAYLIVAGKPHRDD